MTMVVGDQARFDDEDDYPLLVKGDDCPFNTETFNLWGFDPVEKVGLNIHLVASGGDFSRFKATVILYADDNVYANEFTGAARRDGVDMEVLHVTNVEPMKHWSYTFDGPLKQTQPAASAATPFEQMPDAPCSFALDVKMTSPPIEQGTQGDDGVRISSGTIARTARRYEQLAQITGKMRIGDRDVELKACGMRVHRRNSAGIFESGVVGHVWITGSFPSGRGFHVCAYQNEPDAKVGFCHAFYFDGSEHLVAEVVEMPYFSGATTAETYRVELAVGDRRIEVAGLPSPAYMKGFNSPAMQQVLFSRAPGHFSVDGELGGGVIERSLRSDFPAGGSYHDADLPPSQ